MPLIISPSSAVTHHYQQERWHAVGGMSIAVLNQPVSVRPGVTLGHLFDLVDQADDVKAFLGTYLGCDLESLHQKDRTIVDIGETFRTNPDVSDDEIDEDEFSGFLVDPETKEPLKGPVDSIEVQFNVNVYSDEEQPLIRTEWEALAVIRDEKCGMSLNHANPAINRESDVFGHFCSLEIYIGRSMLIQNGQTKTLADEEPSLLDLLVSIYSPFSRSPYSKMTMRDVQQDEEIRRRLEQADDDEDKWWKQGDE